MKAFVFFLMTSILVITACASQQPARPVVTSTYRCESGRTIVAAYPDTDSAVIQYRGVTHKMQIAVSASGARYVGDGMEWWTKGAGKGSEGTLFQHNPDGTTGDHIEFCIEE